MSIGALSSLTTGYIQSALRTAFQSAGITGLSTGAANSSISVQGLQDQGQLSPFAQMLSTLQQLQQSNPTQYQQVTQQISTNLQNAAQTAQSQGNTTAANQLNQLATDFSNASSSGQLPSIQDLAQAIGGGHHHHHHGGGGHSSSASSTDSATDGSSSSSSSTSSSNQSLDSLLSALESESSNDTSSSLNPLTIINQTLQNAGVLGTGQ